MNRIMEQVRDATSAGTTIANSRNGVMQGNDAEKQSKRFAGYYSVISVAAALAAVLMVATILPRHGGVGASAAVPKTGQEKRDYLQHLGVSEFCLEKTALVGLIDANVNPHGNANDCCTDCHYAAGGGPATHHAAKSDNVSDLNSPMSVQHLAVLANSCLACHVAATPPPPVSYMDSLFHVRWPRVVALIAAS